MEGVTFNPPERRFLWTESVHREDFRLRADKSMDGHVARGAVSVFYGNLLLAEVQLSIKVDRKPAESRQEETHARPYRRIFASYSHRDTAIVEEFETHAVATGDRYLRDVVTLRAGEVWDQRLLEMIKQADVFQLFWSWNALSSPLVREEWRQALALNRPHFVRPVYWEEPLPEQAGLPHRAPASPLSARISANRAVTVGVRVAIARERSGAIAIARSGGTARSAACADISLDQLRIGGSCSGRSSRTLLHRVESSSRPRTIREAPKAQKPTSAIHDGRVAGVRSQTTPSVQVPAGANPPPTATAIPPSAALKPPSPAPVEPPATAIGRRGAPPLRGGSDRTSDDGEAAGPGATDASSLRDHFACPRHHDAGPVTKTPAPEIPPAVRRRSRSRILRRLSLPPSRRHPKR